MLFGISGHGRAGKDTLADNLIKDLGGIKLPFAKRLKEIAESVYGPIPRGPRYRYTLQELGRGLRQFDPDFWIKAWYREAEGWRNAGVHIFVPDVRFPNEVSITHMLGGIVIRLDVSPGVQITRGMEMEFRLHETETTLDDCRVFDLTLCSDTC